MALSKLPGRPTPICVECLAGPTAYAQGGFILHVSCIPGLRALDDILALYLRVGRAAGGCAAFPAISGLVPIGGASGLQFTNDVRIVAYSVVSCDPSGLAQEISAGVNLSHLDFCVTVKGR